MLTVPNRKNKIDLSQYNYKKDIENRIILGTFSFLDVQVLEEILYSSIQIPISSLLSRLSTSREDLILSLEKIRQTGLISIQNDVIFVDKELRKFFETHTAKFDENFEPNLDYIQNLLRLIPIHVLPLWYVLPRSADNIFKCIVERIFTSVRMYEKYLSEISFEDVILNGIIEDLFCSANLRLDADEICRKYGLSEETFFEYALQLEYNFIAYISYVATKDNWKLFIVPFSEWQKFIKFKKDTFPQTLKDSSVETYDKKSLEKKSKFFSCPPYLFTDKNSREMERGLRALIESGWVLIDDFLKNASICLDESSHLILKKQGKHWKFIIPEYTLEEQAYILSSLYGRFHKLGFIEIGISNDKDCFRLTPQGKSYLLSLLL